MSGVWTNSSRISSEGSSIKTFGFPTGQSTQVQDTASASISNPVSETTFLTIAVPPTSNSPGQSSPSFTESGSLPTNAENVTAEVTFSTPFSTPSPSSWPSWTTKSACNGSVADSIVKSSTFTTTWTITTTSFSTGNGDAPCTHLDSSNVTAAWSNTTCTSTTSSCGGLSQSPGSTTLRTMTTMRGESGSVDPNTFYQPLPTDIVTTPPKVKDELPSNPDYPWGGGSPIHRHQIVDEPKEHASNSIGGRSKIKNWLWGGRSRGSSLAGSRLLRMTRMEAGSKPLGLPRCKQVCVFDF
uniref:Uncharacterized protein n=1 Tax=Bionectria ochroleuca TaxID=29856 RepID=A0A8H7TUE7_BIOOC